MKIDDYRFDKRLLERNIEKDIISREDLNKYLSKLPDNKKKRELVDLSAELKNVMRHNRNSGGSNE